MRVTLKTSSRVSCYIKPPYTMWQLWRFKGLSEVNARVNVFISVKEWLLKIGMKKMHWTIPQMMLIVDP